MPRSVEPIVDLASEMDHRLKAPLGSVPLHRLVRPGARVVIVVDDVQRPTPAHLVVDRVLDEIEAGGVPASEVTTVFALGLHRAMTDQEMRRKVGIAYERMRCINHDAFDPRVLEDLGYTSRGTRIALQRDVARADVRVLVGCVEPHVQAGFGGGFKNLLPGVAASDAVGHNHYLGANPRYFSMVGWMPEDNPMRQDIEEFGCRLPGVTFAVNLVLDSQGEVVQFAAGDPTQVHRACIDTARQMYGVDIPEQADVVLTDSHPMDINLRQGVKGVANALFAARPGGVIISLNRCDLGVDDVRLPARFFPPATLARGLLWLVGRRGIHHLVRWLPRSIPPENRFFIYFAMQAFRRNQILIYSPNLVRDLGGVHLPVGVSADLGEVLGRADRLLSGRNPLKCIVFPFGGVTYPILPVRGGENPIRGLR